MKKFPPKERPTWCNLRPLLTWEEVIASEDAPLWLEAKGFEHLNQWGLVDIDDFTGAVTVLTKKGTWDIKEKYGEKFIAYSPLPTAK